MAVVQQELQALMEKHESLERDSKTRESELASALESAKTAKADAHKSLQGRHHIHGPCSTHVILVIFCCNLNPFL